MQITLEQLKQLDACREARDWFSQTYPDGCELTEATVSSCPEAAWVWWLAVRLDTKQQLVWKAANIAFREAAKVNPALSVWVGKVNKSNWREARRAAAAADAAAYAAAAAAAAYAAAAAAAAAYAAAAAAAAAYAADAAAAAAAAYAAAREAAWQEIRQLATELLLSL